MRKWDGTRGMVAVFQCFCVGMFSSNLALMGLIALWTSHSIDTCIDSVRLLLSASLVTIGHHWLPQIGRFSLIMNRPTGTWKFHNPNAGPKPEKHPREPGDEGQQKDQKHKTCTGNTLEQKGLDILDGVAKSDMIAMTTPCFVS